MDKIEPKTTTVLYKEKEFVSKKTYKNKIYFRCKHHKYLKCKASLVLNSISYEYKLITNHNNKCLNLFDPIISKNETMENTNPKNMSNLEVSKLNKTTLLSNESSPRRKSK
jgi:hypothetical protein